jgi:hypothetical protein
LPNAAWHGLVCSQDHHYRVNRHRLAAQSHPCQTNQSGPSSPNPAYALIRQSPASPQSAPPSTEAAQGQCSAQTIPGTLHRGPVAYLQSVHGPVLNRSYGTLPAQTKDNAPYQNPLHGSGDGSLYHAVSARLGGVG